LDDILEVVYDLVVSEPDYSISLLFEPVLTLIVLLLLSCVNRTIELYDDAHRRAAKSAM